MTMFLVYYNFSHDYAGLREIILFFTMFLRKGRGFVTYEKLMKYRAIKAEIKQLEGLIEKGRSRFAGQVQTSAGFPYQLESLDILTPESRWLQTWHNRLRECEGLIMEIENFIESVEDERIKTILRYRCYNKLPWQAVAMRIGLTASDTPPRMVKNFFSQRRVTSDF